MKKVKRRITDRMHFEVEAFGRTGVTVRLKLACGHVEWRKGSREPKGDYAECKDCSCWPEESDEG